MKKSRTNILIALISLVITLLAGEAVLRATGYCKTYSERRDGTYNDFSDYDHHNIWWRQYPNNDFKIETPEFTVVHHINSLGFSGGEFHQRTDSNEIRILTLGDSFTYGDGGTGDSSYPSVLQGLLNARFPGKKITVFNGGTCGSDPVFGFMAYTRLLQDTVNPDIIIQAFHDQDLREDFVIRKGFERYDNDSSMTFKGIKFRWKNLYHYSHLARLFFRNFLGYNEYYINNAIVRKSMPEDVKTMKEVDALWNDTLKPGQQFFYLLHPDPIEIEKDKYETIFQTVLDSMAPGMGKLGVIDFRYWLVHQYHIKNDSIMSIYWPKDRHHNSKGYSLMALCVADKLTPILNERFKDK
ncbi:MAG TPA: hypothetical protein VG603_07110 [Chitinophagales bacterium]|nr:hypothetical protein [Chitinophagales bacterium]